MKNILVLGGSSSATSINQKLAEYASQLLEGQYSLNIQHLRNYEMPNFCIQKMQTEGAPQQAHEFLKAIEDADAIILSTSEHNRNITATLKNTLDWTSRINVKMFGNKPMLLMSTSPGGFGGQNARNAFELMAPMFEANIVAKFALPKFNEHFAEGKIIDAALQQELADAVKTLENSIA